MKKMPRKTLLDLCYDANEGPVRGMGKSASVGCTCGDVDMYGDRWHDKNCPRCHGTGLYKRNLSRRGRHIIHVWNQQEQKRMERIWQAVYASMGVRYTRRMKWDVEKDVPVYPPRYSTCNYAGRAK